MTVLLRRAWIAQTVGRLREFGVSWEAPAFFRRPASKAALAGFLLALLYWGLIASDRYVSEAHIVIHRVDSSVSTGTSGQKSDTSTGAMVVEQMLLRDHLLSVDMLVKLDAALKLREHYSDRHRDPISRMWSKDHPMEWFHRHYLSRVSVELDLNAGVLVIQAAAYDAQTAYAIATMLVKEGERYMNELGQRLAAEQVAFLEKQVAQLHERVLVDRQALIAYQNRKGLVSPQSTAENLAGIINRLEGQRTDLQTRLSAMKEYLMPDSPAIVEIEQQITAVEKQIARETTRLTSPNGQSLNRTVEEYQRLQMNAELSAAVYKTALAALEQGRIEAARKLMNVYILQNPVMPQYPLEPRRVYSITIAVLAICLIYGTILLLVAIVRDHKD
jgi:capsular polysaccharide transport system permease protein